MLRTHGILQDRIIEQVHVAIIQERSVRQGILLPRRYTSSSASGAQVLVRKSRTFRPIHIWYGGLVRHPVQHGLAAYCRPSRTPTSFSPLGIKSTFAKLCILQQRQTSIVDAREGASLKQRFRWRSQPPATAAHAGALSAPRSPHCPGGLACAPKPPPHTGG